MLYRLPILLLGLVAAAYWYRVIRMAYKMRRRDHGANFLPPEPLGRLLRLLWIPLATTWVIHPFITALVPGAPWALRPLYAFPAVAWPAAVVAGACLGASLVCWRRMGRSWRMGIDPDERNPLISTGPFVYVRHPIYALSSLMMMASMAALPSPAMLALGLLHLSLLQWEAVREERHMLRVHGPQYQRYQARTGRFLPRIGSLSHRNSAGPRQVS